MGASVRSELIQSGQALILLTLGYSLLGLKYPWGLAVIGAIGWLIRWAGELLAVIPLLLVGLMMTPGLVLSRAANGHSGASLTVCRKIFYLLPRL